MKHDYSYKRIKRKSNRWIKNLDELGADERNYILGNILDKFSKEVAGHF